MDDLRRGVERFASGDWSERTPAVRDETGRLLVCCGARAQRPLWASTGARSRPAPDTMYVSELAIADTVYTRPSTMLGAFAEAIYPLHPGPGRVRA